MSATTLVCIALTTELVFAIDLVYGVHNNQKLHCIDLSDIFLMTFISWWFLTLNASSQTTGQQYMTLISRVHNCTVNSMVDIDSPIIRPLVRNSFQLICYALRYIRKGKSKTSIAKKNPYPLQNNDGNCWLESKPILNACLGYISDEIHFLMVSYIKCELTVGQPDNSLYCRNYSTLTKRMSNICVVQPCFHRGAVLFKINLAKPERMRVWLQQYISYYCFSQSFLLISQSHFSGCSAHQAQVFAQLTTWQPVHPQTIKWSNFLISTYPNLCPCSVHDWRI